MSDALNKMNKLNKLNKMNDALSFKIHTLSIFTAMDKT